MSGGPGGAEVIVVGGGVTGLSSAWWLAQQGRKVLVLDKGIVGWEASGRNGGGCTHHYSPLFAEEQRLWPQLHELLGYPTEWRPWRIRIALDEEELLALEPSIANCHRQGFAADRLDGREVRELVPFAGGNALGGALYKTGGHANPQRTVQAYAWAVRDRGGEVLQHRPVTGFTTRGGRVTGVQTPAGSFACDELVIAAGPQTGVLTARLGVEVPVTPARAEMIVTEPLPLMAHGGVDGHGLYGRQTLRGNLAYGGGLHEWLEAPAADMSLPKRTSTPLLRSLAARLARLLPRAAHARVIRSWAGLVECTPDGRPVIDRLPTFENVVVATMSSVGFGLSPASGHAVAELVSYKECRFADLASFRLARFGNLGPTWRPERGWVPPPAAP